MRQLQFEARGIASALQSWLIANLDGSVLPAANQHANDRNDLTEAYVTLAHGAVSIAIDAETRDLLEKIPLPDTQILCVKLQFATLSDSAMGVGNATVIESATLKILKDNVEIAAHDVIREAGHGHEQNDLLFTLAQLHEQQLIHCSDVDLQYINQALVARFHLVTKTTDSPSGDLYNLINQLYPEPPHCVEEMNADALFRHIQPPVSTEYLAVFESPGLIPTLAPFQSQNVKWMLERENHIVDDSGLVQPRPRQATDLPILWEPVEEGSGAMPYINRVSRDVQLKRTESFDAAVERSFRGGILADEMGLGKTVCVIALVMKHRLDANDLKHPNPSHFPELCVAPTTLIVTPSSIIQQWESELRRHAPSLKVIRYHGVKGVAMDQVISPQELSSYDVVLTDYEVLRNEIHHARGTSGRPRRHAARYLYQKSPLVRVLWFRCIVDEAQMVESPVSQTTAMVRMIPRWYSWCVTGTPVKNSLDDLHGLYTFLGHHPHKSVHTFYKTPKYQRQLWAMTQRTMRRNMKANLVDQIHIPPQKRFVARIPFSSIEQQYYDNLFQACREDVHLDFIQENNWVLDGLQKDPQQIYSSLRQWASNYTNKQACVHPNAVTGRRRQFARTFRNMKDVLDSLLNQARDRVDNAALTVAACRLIQGGMNEVLEQWNQAAELYQSGIAYAHSRLDIINTRVEECRGTSNDSDENKEEDMSHDLFVLVARQNRWIGVLHQYYFYLAGVYHNQQLEDEETLYYDKAATVRRQLLARPLEKVLSGKKELERSFVVLQDEKYKFNRNQLQETPLLTQDLLDHIVAITSALDDQLPVIETWREDIKKILFSSLVDQGDNEATGDEFETSMLIQEKASVYQDAFRALLHDRIFWMNDTRMMRVGSNSDLDSESDNDIDEDSENRNPLKTMPQAKNLDVKTRLTESLSETVPKQETVKEQAAQEEEPIEEEVELLKLALDEDRMRFAPNKEESYSLSTIINVLRDIITETTKEISQNNPPLYEKHEIQALKTSIQVLKANIQVLASYLHQQRELQERLESEYRKFVVLYNHRIEYYRSLQDISDHVISWSSEDPHGAIRDAKQKEAVHEEIIKEQSSRCRYLENLAMEQSEQRSDRSRQCLICTGEFTKGLMTHCGHMLCRDCADIWFNRNSRCPQCNAAVQPNECYPFTWGDAGKTTLTFSHNEVDPSITQLLQEVGQCSIVTGLGAKLDGIIRHIMHIKQTTGGKCVVFSQWADVLQLLASGLTANGIGHVMFESRKNKKRDRDASVVFREDPNIHVILLHARSQSSGLTLVAAQTVFIVEPVLNEALELQAVSRVHRIGQTKETQVFSYIVPDTIEERIHTIHNKRRRLDRGHEEGRIRMGKLSEGGGEYVSDMDVRQCFSKEEPTAE